MADDLLGPPDGLVRQLVRNKARQLLFRAGMRGQDEDDLIQELTLHLLKKLVRFDRTRGPLAAFARLALDSAAANLLRRGAVENRLRPVSLHSPSHAGGEDGTLASVVGDPEYNARRRYHPPDAAGLADSELDLAEALDRLPPALRSLAENLALGKTLSEVAREQDVPRTTLNDRVRKLRSAFERPAEF
jgi:RNA polymerase sigma factor (sigma-70 family)